MKTKNNNWKQRVDVVYSTNSDYRYNSEEQGEQNTLPKEQQKLRVFIDKHNRGGKVVTLIKGFVGTETDLQALAKILKVKCGVGGSTKAGEILIQGEHREQIIALLRHAGYTDVK